MLGPQAASRPDLRSCASGSCRASTCRQTTTAVMADGDLVVGMLLTVFRELIGAGLIVGIVLTATRGIVGRGRWIALGLGAGLAGAALVAVFADEIARLVRGAGQELLNAALLIVAVAMLVRHNAWAARHAHGVPAVGHARGARARPPVALAVVVAVAVMRDGSAAALFLYGTMTDGASGSATLAGGLFGLAAGAAVSAVGYAALLIVPARHRLAVTSALIVLVAAGFAAQAAQSLASAGLVDMLDRRLWDSSGWLAEDGLAGRVLRTLVGYTDRPTELDAMAYVGTILAMVVLMRAAAPTRREPMPALVR